MILVVLPVYFIARHIQAYLTNWQRLVEVSVLFITPKLTPNTGLVLITQYTVDFLLVFCHVLFR